MVIIVGLSSYSVKYTESIKRVKSFEALKNSVARLHARVNLKELDRTGLYARVNLKELDRTGLHTRVNLKELDRTGLHARVNLKELDKTGLHARVGLQCVSEPPFLYYLSFTGYKTLWEKEKTLVSCIFFLFPQCLV